MKLFSRGPRGAAETPADLDAAAEPLAALFEASLTDPDGRVRVEDLLTAAAAVCGEACIVAAGEFDPEDHRFTPGSAVLSDRVNGILCDDANDWAAAGESVFGIVYRGALANGYEQAQFPRLADVFRGYVASLAGAGEDAVERWGFVALSVPEDNWPQIAPIRLAYELRRPARAILREQRVSERAWPAACAGALVRELARVRAAIHPAIAIRIVLETTNGMAKMAPMTERHLREADSTEA